MKKWLRVFRVEDYIKNLLVFFPAFFGGVIWDKNTALLLIAVFLIFCCLASGVYLINDCFDQSLDSKHPVKRTKPIASGSISRQLALGVAVALIAWAVSSAGLLSALLLYLVVAYVLINLAYSSFAKHIPVVDLLLIASGFMLRLQAGGIVSGVVISHWLYGMIALLALVFGLAKRLEETRILARHQVSVESVRPSLRFYNHSSTQRFMIALVAIAGVCYCLYTVSEETISRLGSRQVFLTSIPVAIGIGYYIRLLLQPNESIMPQTVLRQHTSIQVSLLAWLVMMAYFIYS